MHPSSPSNSRTFSSLQKETPYLLNYHSSPPSPSSWQPLTYFLSLWMCLFWTCHINRITHYEAFCVWLLSLSTMCSRSLHDVAGARASLLFIAFFLPPLFPNCLRGLNIPGLGCADCSPHRPPGQRQHRKPSWGYILGAEAGRGQQREVRIMEPVARGL